MADVPAIRITAIDDASKVIDQIGRSLGGLVTSVVSIQAVMQTFRAALDFGDELQTTNEKLGISIDKLQELSAIAVQSGTSLEGFGKAYKALAQSMTAAQNATSEQAKVFRALGVAVKDAQGNMRPLGDVTADAADALNKVGNETTRTAAGIVLFGKGYLEVAAALRTYRQSQEEANRIIGIFGTVTATAAASADMLGDKIKLIEQGFKATTLNEMSRGFASLSASIDGSTSSIQKFAEYIGHGFALDMRDLSVLLTRVQQAFESLGVMATRTWEAIRERSRAPLAQIGKDIEGIVQKYEAMRGAIRSSFAFPGLDNEDQVSRRAGASERVKQAQIDAKALQDALTTGVNKTTEALEAMVKAQEAALASTLKLTEVDKLYIALSHMKLGTLKGEQLELVKRLTVIAQQVDAAKEQAASEKLVADAIEASNKAWIEKIDNETKAYEASLKQIENAADLVAQMEEENRLMTMTDAEREREIALRKLQATGIDQTSEAYKGLLARMDEAVAQKGAMQQQIDLWGKIDDAAHDAFTHIYEGGKSVFERLLNSLKQIGLELLYLATKRWVINLAIGGGAAGAAGGAGAQGLGSLGNLLGGGGFLSGLADSSGLTAGMGNLALGAGFSGSMATTIAANAIPIVGTILAVGGGLIYNWLESKKGGPKTGGFATSGAIGMLGGYKDSSGRWVTPNDADAQLKQYTDATLKSYHEFAKAFGVKALVGFAQGFTSDPQGTAGNILHTQAFVNGKSVYEVAIGDLGRDSKELADRMALENKRALIAALQGSDLPGVLSKLFANLVPTTITGEIADSILTFAGAYKNLYDVFNASPLDDALNAVADAAEGAQRAVEKQGEALLDLLAIYDGTGDSTTALATATQAYYGNVVALIAQMEQLKQTIADMFAGSIKQYTFAKLDKGGQYKYLQADVQSAYGQLQMSTSATEIDRLTKQIDAAMREMFGLLSPKEQAQQADKFITNATKINEAAQAQLAKAEKAQEEKLNAILTAIRTAIDQAAANLSGSADDLSNAADDLSGAVGTQQPATVNA